MPGANETSVGFHAVLGLQPHACPAQTVRGGSVEVFSRCGPTRASAKGLNVDCGSVRTPRPHARPAQKHAAPAFHRGGYAFAFPRLTRLGGMRPAMGKRARVAVLPAPQASRSLRRDQRARARSADMSALTSAARFSKMRSAGQSHQRNLSRRRTVSSSKRILTTRQGLPTATA